MAAHCRRFVKTNYHPASTAKMGADGDRMAVLDALSRGMAQGAGGHQWPPIIRMSEADGYFFKSGSAELSPTFQEALLKGMASLELDSVSAREERLADPVLLRQRLAIPNWERLFEEVVHGG